MIGQGIELRLRRFFDQASGTAIIVPMDHGVEGPEYVELEDPRPVVSDLVEAGANGFLMRRGLARFTAEVWGGRAAWAQRITGRTGLAHLDKDQLFIASPEGALLNGADAVCYTVFLGGHREVYDYPLIGQTADTCNRIGLPLLAEIFPAGGPEALAYDGPYETDDLRVAVRVACEEGAHFIKTFYTGDSKSFARVVAYSTLPVLIAGGPKADTVEKIFAMVKGSLDGGGRGIVMGRKVWQSPDPAATMRALVEIVRHGADVDTALRQYNDQAKVSA
jgi:DhnA family fructose-bisphosphate aldolase class Ia